MTDLNATISEPPSHLRPYPEYKDSGVDWLGQIPAHWNVVRLKSLSALRSGQSITSASIRSAGPYPVFGGNGLRGYTTESTHDGEHVLIGRVGAHCGNIHMVSGSFWASEHAVVVTPHGDTAYGWLGAILEAMSLKRWSMAAAQPSLAVEQLRDLQIAVPPRAEQLAIADFLDRETARIDALITKKEGLIRLLQEERSALITHTVTKGLDPGVPTRDSGVEWLGEIPVAWDVRRLKALSTMRSGESITSASIESAGPYPVFGGNGLRGYTADFTHDGEHVLIGRQGAHCGNVHIARGRFWASEHAVVATLRGGNVFAWFGALLEAMNLNRQSMTAAQPGLAVEQVRDLKVPVPPVGEQLMIANVLDSETARIDRLVSKANEATERLREYRKAVTSAAVTGRIDVRDNRGGQAVTGRQAFEGNA